MDAYEWSMVERVRELGFYVIPKDRVVKFGTKATTRSEFYGVSNVNVEEHVRTEMVRNLSAELVKHPYLLVWDKVDWDVGMIHHSLEMRVIVPKATT